MEPLLIIRSVRCPLQSRDVEFVEGVEGAGVSPAVGRQGHAGEGREEARQRLDGLHPGQRLAEAGRPERD